MAVTEPLLPKPFESNLLKARDIVVAQVQEWMGAHASHATIGHMGPVTQEFIAKQATMAPCSIVTVADGQSYRLGHGMTIQCVVTWGWYIVVRGVMSDRSSNSINFIARFARIIFFFIIAAITINDKPVFQISIFRLLIRWNPCQFIYFMFILYTRCD